MTRTERKCVQAMVNADRHSYCIPKQPMCLVAKNTAQHRRRWKYWARVWRKWREKEKS